MGAQHTAGPHWVEGSIYDGYAACVVGRVSVEGAADRETRTLAQVRSLPDAMLYAAAAELLEAAEMALQALVGVDAMLHKHGMMQGAQCPAIPTLEAAIAKARGAA